MCAPRRARGAILSLRNTPAGDARQFGCLVERGRGRAAGARRAPTKRRTVWAWGRWRRSYPRFAHAEKKKTAEREALGRLGRARWTVYRAASALAKFAWLSAAAKPDCRSADCMAADRTAAWNSALAIIPRSSTSASPVRTF